MIVKTNKIFKGWDAFVFWPFLFIRPEFADGKGELLEHEMVHYRNQAWITPIWQLRYFLSKSYRWKQEVKAYRVQVGRGGISKERAAKYLTTYKTGHTLEQAMEALS